MLLYQISQTNCMMLGLYLKVDTPLVKKFPALYGPKDLLQSLQNPTVISYTATVMVESRPL